MKSRAWTLSSAMVSAVMLAVALATLVRAAEMKPPQVGDAAVDFKLSALGGDTLSLKDLMKQGPVVVAVLRGYPGYQCPACNQQVGQFLSKAEQFRAAGAQVVLVYPGAVKNLETRAQEFLTQKTLPTHFHLVLDDKYQLTNAYGLRWDAPNETAYPSTFVIGRDGKVAFAKISKSHGDRAKVDDVLQALSAR